MFILVITLPTVLMMMVNIRQYTADSTNFILKTKETQSILAATAVTEKLDGYFDLARSFATRPLLVQNIERSRWKEAMRVLGGVFVNYPDIDRIVLYGKNAVIMAEMPETGAVGQSRANMEWYREYSKKQVPSLSGVYRRLTNPRKSVISVVMPVYPLNAVDRTEKLAKPIAILQLQLRLGSLHGWTNINVGYRGLIYIFDQNGHIVYHPNYENDDKIIDFSSVGIVRKALKGENGAEINYNEVEHELRAAGFQKLPKYGWGVVVTQDANEAFAKRNRDIRNLYINYISIICLAVMLGIAILYILMTQRKTEEILRDLALQDELTDVNNRRGFKLLARQQLITADRLKEKLFLAYIDINKMKSINDRFGHNEGDNAIIDAAMIIKRVFRESDIKARIGGDEFAVLGVIKDEFEVETIRNKFLSYSSENVGKVKRPYRLTLSSGFVVYDPQNPCTVEELMERADLAMYEIKMRRSVA